MKSLFWTGPRLSDILYTGDLFSGAATFYGEENENCTAYCSSAPKRINHNVFHQEASDFILNWQLLKIQEDPECRFMAYNPNCVFGAPEEVVRRTLCLNDESLMKRLDNKVLFRELMQGTAPLLPAALVKGCDCSVSHLRELDGLDSYLSYIVQESVASGGQGTFLLSEQTMSDLPRLSSDTNYIVSGYRRENVSVNLHGVIFRDEILFTPGSVQVLKESDNRLLYRGADFVTFREIEQDIRDQIYGYSRMVCEKLQQMGYRGVLGLDWLIADGQVYLLEINNRFQGSSLLVNRALSEQGLPSLQALQYDAFYGASPDAAVRHKVENLCVPYSFYTVICEDDLFSSHLLTAAKRESRVVDVIMEGYREEQPSEPFASQFILVFQTNITSLCDNRRSVRLHPNLKGLSPQFATKIFHHDLTALKTALINRGAVMTPEAVFYMEHHKKMRQGTYFSLDLYLEGTYINCPLYAKFTTFSPFVIDFDDSENGLVLRLYDRVLDRVEYDIQPRFTQGVLASGTPVDEICFVATDRLRLQNSPTCTFVKNQCPCRFCEAVGVHNRFSQEDILEAIRVAFREQPTPFRHILIGGLSNDIGEERDTILRMCKEIRKFSEMPIYLMCLPPTAEDIRLYYQAGVTEFGFNIEVYDRSIARQTMPGKGAIPLEHYLSALQTAVSLAGNTGAVRSAFIAGLEPMESLLEGVRAICEVGAAPIISVFRPIYGTSMQEHIPPDDEWLMELLRKAEEICQQYHLSLGPTCPACRNNTLSMVTAGESSAVRIVLEEA